jgi:hypothetical protein
MSPLVGLVVAIAVAPAVYPQVDLTLRRQFKLQERLALQARADFFGIFNHPNFGPGSIAGAAARMAASTLSTRLADRARSSWRLSFNSEKTKRP